MLRAEISIPYGAIKSNQDYFVTDSISEFQFLMVRLKEKIITIL